MTLMRSNESIGDRGLPAAQLTANPHSAGDSSKARDPQISRSTVLLVVDVRHLSRESLAEWLRTKVPKAGIRTFATIDQAADYAIEGDIADLVVLYNIGAASVLDPSVAERVRSLKERLPGAATLVLSDNDGIDHVMEALQLNVGGYVPSTTATAVLVGAIELVRVGGTFVPTDALKSLQRQIVQPRTAPTEAELGDFTPRQTQVLSCLRQGMSNKIIAYELGMSESTVKVHVRHIMKKLRATNRTQVVCMTNELFEAAEQTPL